MAKAATPGKVTHAVVRMYCMGTGDCFVVKYFKGTKHTFTMMIDCGVWTGAADHLRPYMEDLRDYVKKHIDLLVVTHEHVDHVSVFEACKDIFVNEISIDRIWMGWTEDDSLSKIRKWKTEYGEKKKALSLAAERIEKALEDPALKNSILSESNGFSILAAKKSFAESIKDFAGLHVNAVNGVYKGPLEGMRIVKKELAKENIEYCYPGDIIEDLPGAEGIKFYVLGPPEKWAEVKTEGGGEGETYTHNTDLRGTDAFAASILSQTDSVAVDHVLPFDETYETKEATTVGMYKDVNESWRNIETDWLFSAGSLALRVSSLTNNLSLALGIEFEDSKRVMLFPGDAEYGSWASWHEINWNGLVGENNTHYTQDLLRRTVFYKVAHHMSHNGTAQRLGLEMMEHKDLTAMATLDYDVIAPKWKNTMPNREMLQELLKRTKGRVMIMHEDGLFYDFDGKVPLIKKIKDARKKMTQAEQESFDQSYMRHPENMYVQFTVKGT